MSFAKNKLMKIQHKRKSDHQYMCASHTIKRSSAKKVVRWQSEKYFEENFPFSFDFEFVVHRTRKEGKVDA
jgi:hypothetical protein